MEFHQNPLEFHWNPPNSMEFHRNAPEFTGIHRILYFLSFADGIELLEDKKYPFLYPDPLVSGPPLPRHVTADIAGTQEKIFPWRDLEFHTLFPLQRL